jgi:GTP-binding protein
MASDEMSPPNSAVNLRNIAIIAHVDHGKTTLTDQLLKQTKTLSKQQSVDERVMDSNDLERERGITITSKNTALNWQGYRINIVDTPGHVDFGGEVERILSMVDGVLLLVDAVDGPMPQTRFVTEKAFAHGLHPIVVVNKIDRPQARPFAVVDEVFDLFDNLGATDEQLDFTTLYGSALSGFMVADPAHQSDNMDLLLQTIVKVVPPPAVDMAGPLQLQITSLDYSSYVGAIGIGRIQRGQVQRNQAITLVTPSGEQRAGKVGAVYVSLGLDRIEVEQASAGDIVAISGVQPIFISDTICAVEQPQALPELVVDEPTVRLFMRVNNSPFAGREGRYVTSRNLQERLERELIANVALRMEGTKDPNIFLLSGRGELHLGVLMENMRREGYEFSISAPQVVVKELEGKRCEPYEQLVLDVEAVHQGSVVSLINDRGGLLQSIRELEGGRMRVIYELPTRSLLGLRSTFLSTTQGSGLMSHRFIHYGPWKSELKPGRRQGVLIANGPGKALAYALWQLQPRGRMFIGPQTQVYEGMIIGLHSKENDLIVNPTRAKQLTNVRASGTDEKIQLTPPIQMTLEQAISFLAGDELLEVTPQSLRLRKLHLKEHERKRASRE